VTIPFTLEFREIDVMITVPLKYVSPEVVPSGYISNVFVVTVDISVSMAFCAVSVSSQKHSALPVQLVIPGLNERADEPNAVLSTGS